MTQGELEVIRNIISRLKCGRDGKEVRASIDVERALKEEHLHIYLDTWVIGPLELLTPEIRNVPLAVKMSR